MSKQISKTIVITGTHQSPAIELIRQLKLDKSIKWNIVYIGRKYHSHSSRVIATEYDLLQSNPDVKYFIVQSGKFDRRFIPNTILGLPHTFIAIFKSLIYLKNIKPDVIASFGGYISIPVLIAGKILGIPSIIHEQTLTNSLTTKLSLPFVNKIALSFENKDQIRQLPKHKVVITGNLLRREIFLKHDPKLIYSWFKKRRDILYITGGNQGSTEINKIILLLLPKLTEKFNVIHQTGKYDLSNIKAATSNVDNYICSDYYLPETVSNIYQNSALIISRSGANITQELVAIDKKAIFIPLPVSQQNEQLKNAQWAKKQSPNNFVVIPQNQLSSTLLLEEIEKLDKQGTNQSKKIIVASENHKFIDQIKRLLF